MSNNLRPKAAMIFRRAIVVPVFLFALLTPFTPGAAQIQLKNPGFEQKGPDGIPADWHVVSPPDSATTIGVDPAVKKAGSGSVRITHGHPATTALESGPVQLEVGKPYRLSGWIKTEGVAADPVSRYPTALPAVITMASFPFTLNSPPVGGTCDWERVEVLFFATTKNDRVRIHCGYNGTASGTAWFDELRIEKVDDISALIPPETVRWYGPAFRYTDRGWTFVHIEGEPYQRGYQYGYLLAKEITAFIEKLSVRANTDNPSTGWRELRTLTDALMLRKYDEEFLAEMKGIADGAAKGGALAGDKPVDFLDIVTVNSSVDLGQLSGALAKTANPLSGRSFHQEEEEAAMQERLHKCSSFLATGPASRDGRIVFGQLFMWGGYTGVHWEVICDVIPAKGHRLVYETFPGGIHSAADFYINDAGIMIGETTVMQTPFNADGEPQSSRIRKAAQYAQSIDDVVKILTRNNNGLYTNDWLIGDTKTDEVAILLLGTEKYKLWRSTSGEFPGGTDGYYWSVNNAKDPEVRKEYVPDPTNAPFDVVFSPWNRDLTFTEFYRTTHGKIDARSAVNLLASSPINRPHACDGKVTTSEMAEQMMFLAHFGKVTLREKFPERNSRLMPDLTNAIPHLSLGYSIVNPKFVTEQLQRLHAREPQQSPPTKPQENLERVKDLYQFDKSLLWLNTVYPAAEADNWFVSGTAAYWRMLDGLPSGLPAGMVSLRDQLAENSCRLQYTTEREGSIAPLKAERRYDRYGHYQIPRIKGVFALHQLRLLLGNAQFSTLMNSVHTRFKEKEITTKQFIAEAEKVGGKDCVPWIEQWIERDDVPRPRVRATATQSTKGGWNVALVVDQDGSPYRFIGTVALETDHGVEWKTVKVQSGHEELTFAISDKPRTVTFNPGNDIPVPRKNFYVFSNYFDDFDHSILVYGTSRQVEANHTLALRYQTVLADAFTEILPPLRKDCEVSAAELASCDLILLGGVADNRLTGQIAEKAGLSLGKDMFVWKGKTYGAPDDGVIVTLPNPYNPARVAYFIIANSALQLWQMTRRNPSVPSWGVFKGEKVVEKGYHPVEGMQIVTE